MATSKQPVALVTGVGPGLGAALARRFASSYALAINARSAGYLRSLGDELRASGARVIEIPADLGDAAQVGAAFAKVRAELGEPELLLYNAGSGTWGTITEITPEQYEASWRVNGLGAFLCAREAAPAMIARGSGVMLFTGATAGVKAGPRSIAFGPAKFAMRGLAQSLARDLGPRGIHVAWINIDGGINSEAVRSRYPQLETDGLLKPEAIAETYWHVAHQDRSAWSMDLEVRP
jgi:NAD(P)-dependent dehydrogenase (short-subunit alcohol dehydrogenase family)